MDELYYGGIGRGTTASLPEMIALLPEMTASRPKIKEICNADD